MATDLIREYEAAKKALDEAHKAAESLVNTLGRTYSRLSHGGWRQAIVAGTVAQLLTGESMPYGGAIGPADLPTIAELRAALAAWHQAVQRTKQTWRQVPEEDRYGLQGPPSP
jgi:hypothetical protein